MIIYDGNCNVCVGLRDMMLLLGLVEQKECVAYTALDARLKQQVSAERFRNEMALIDTGGGETRYGAEGVSFVLADKIRLLRPLFRFKPFYVLFQFLYKTLAFNRYIIAIPRQQAIACDCYPEAAEKFRISFIALAVLLAVLLTALFGVSVHEALGVAPLAGAGQLLLIAGTGWVIHIFIATLTLPRSRTLDYVGHLGTIMVAGLLVLLPAILFYLVSGVLFYPLPALSVACSSGLMLYLHYKRVKYLGMPQRWTLQWFLLLQATAVLWLGYFHL